MAFPKHGRQERRSPATYLTLTGAVFIAFFLVAVWVFSTPSAVPEGTTSQAKSVTSVNNEEDTKAHAFEDAPITDETSPEDDTTKVTESELAVEETNDSAVEVTKSSAPVKEESTEGDSKGRDLGADNKDEPRPDKPLEVKRDDTPADKTEDKTLKPKREDLPPVDVGPEKPLEGKTAETPAEKIQDKTLKSNKEDLPPIDAGNAEVATDTKEGDSSWTSQAKESKEEKEVIKDSGELKGDDLTGTSAVEDKKATPEDFKAEEEQEKSKTLVVGEEVTKKPRSEKYSWKLCTGKSAHDFIPCLDNKKWLDRSRARKHYEHRERHCPSEEDLPKCLVPLPPGYKAHVKWPESRDEVWYDNVPHSGLVSYKADQNWVKKTGEKLRFPGGGTQFKDGVGHYIDFIEKIYPDIKWGKRTRVLLDVGCGVASFGGYLFEKDVLAMSFAPKDEHEAQVQLALERGIPAFSSVMGTQRLVFPSNSFDVVHCARCRVPWEKDGGMLLLELNRVLRPGGVFVWSATPVYQDLEEDKQLWNATIAVIEAMAWKQVAKKTDEETQIGVAIFQKPLTNEAYKNRTVEKPEMCAANNSPDAAWYVKMTPCIHSIPASKRSEWPEEWPTRLKATPKWLSNNDIGLYGKAAPEDYRIDTEHWENVVQKTYLKGVGIDWTTIRNVMDMKAGYGGFAAALVPQKVWVLNVIPTSEPDTLPIVYDRGFIGMHHDWCEPHSTYPRTYDLLHADHLVSSIESKCNILNLVMEMDRILRPDGWAIFRDKKETLAEVEEIVKSLHWDVTLTFSRDSEELLAVQKRFWRPDASS